MRLILKMESLIKGKSPLLNRSTRPKTCTPDNWPNTKSKNGSSSAEIDRNITRSLCKLSVNDQPYRQGRQVHNLRRRFTTDVNGVKTLEDVALYLRDGVARNIVICAGAGLSTGSGIPDFRTPGSGLYDNLKRYNIPYPEAIFDIDYFEMNPRPFFTLAKELYPSGLYRPNYAHYFARLLHDHGVLLRMYTQNIDGLERLAGIPPQKLVEAHGTFSTATCMACDTKYAGYEIKEDIFSDTLPRCKVKRCGGIVKPDIVFFGEDLPKKFYYYLKDMTQADLVIVMGTSLEVQPFAGIIDLVRYNVPRLLFNRDLVGPFRHPRVKDFTSLGDLVTNLRSFVSQIGWTNEMEELISRCEASNTEKFREKDGMDDNVQANAKLQLNNFTSNRNNAKSSTDELSDKPNDKSSDKPNQRSLHTDARSRENPESPKKPQTSPIPHYTPVPKAQSSVILRKDRNISGRNNNEKSLPQRIFTQNSAKNEKFKQNSAKNEKLGQASAYITKKVGANGKGNESAKNTGKIVAKSGVKNVGKSTAKFSYTNKADTSKVYDENRCTENQDKIESTNSKVDLKNSKNSDGKLHEIAEKIDDDVMDKSSTCGIEKRDAISQCNDIYNENGVHENDTGVHSDLSHVGEYGEICCENEVGIANNDLAVNLGGDVTVDIADCSEELNTDHKLGQSNLTVGQDVLKIGHSSPKVGQNAVNTNGKNETAAMATGDHGNNLHHGNLSFENEWEESQFETNVSDRGLDIRRVDNIAKTDRLLTRNKVENKSKLDSRHKMESSNIQNNTEVSEASHSTQQDPNMRYHNKRLVTKQKDAVYDVLTEVRRKLQILSLGGNVTNEFHALRSDIVRIKADSGAHHTPKQGKLSANGTSSGTVNGTLNGTSNGTSNGTPNVSHTTSYPNTLSKVSSNRKALNGLMIRNVSNTKLMGANKLKDHLHRCKRDRFTQVNSVKYCISRSEH